MNGIRNLFGQQIMCCKPYIMGNDTLWLGLLHVTKSREIPVASKSGNPIPIPLPWENPDPEKDSWISLSWSLISGALKSITWIFKGVPNGWKLCCSCVIPKKKSISHRPWNSLAEFKVKSKAWPTSTIRGDFLIINHPAYWQLMLDSLYLQYLLGFEEVLWCLLPATSQASLPFPQLHLGGRKVHLRRSSWHSSSRRS